MVTRMFFRCSFIQYTVLHCNEKTFMCSFSGNCAASVSIYTFICLRAIFIFPGSVHIFPAEEQAGQLWKYINRSQTHECENRDCGRTIPFLGIFVQNFRYWFLQCVQQLLIVQRFANFLNRLFSESRTLITDKWSRKSPHLMSRAGF